MSKEPEPDNLRWQKGKTKKPLPDSILYGQLENDIDWMIYADQRCAEAMARFLILLDEANADERGVIIERAMQHVYERTDEFRRNLKGFVDSIKAEQAKP